MKKIIITLFACIIIGLTFPLVYVRINMENIKKDNQQKDSTINWYQNRYIQDSILIRDIAVFTNDNIRTELIFKFNHRNVKSYN